MTTNYREILDKQEEENTEKRNEKFNEMADKLKRPEGEKEFIEKTINNFDSAYSNKSDVKELLLIIFNRLNELENK